MDLELLHALNRDDGKALTTGEEAARKLGCPEAEAQQRLDHLRRDGYVAGPLVAGFGAGEWRDFGYGLLAKGRDALEAQ